MFEFENFINVASLFNINRISKNIKKECNTKKLPHSTPKLRVIPAILRLTKKEKKSKHESREEMKFQLLEHMALPKSNFNNIHKTETRQTQIKTVKLLPHSKNAIA